MSKELKAPDKVTQKMTRDGAVAENLTTGETSSISERPQEENYSAPAGVAAEKVVQHIGAEIERHAAKGAEKKALDATQPKTHSSRLQFSEAERATPELQKAIKKSDKAADCLDAARAAIPKQTKIKKERVFDEAKGKAKTRLSFEKTDKPPSGKLRRDKFRAIVHTHFCRIASPGGYAVKHTNDTGCRHVGVHFHGQYFTAEIVKHVERAKTLTVHQRIAHKVHRPATVDDGLRLQTDGSSAG